MPGPLDGVRIIDLTQMISGPFATSLLGDQGADVIKVESPAGDLARHHSNRRAGLPAGFATANRSKRSIALNLKSDAGREVLDKLIATADVFVQNFRPGVIERMGFGEDRVRADRPEIIYVSITGFGPKGPYAKKRVYDPLVQALSGLATVQGGADDDRPRLVRTILPDKLTAMTAAQAIAAALYSREKTGRGEHIRLSMLGSMVYFLWPLELDRLTYIETAEGKVRPEGGTDLIYRTADGYMTVAVISDAEWAGFCKATERPDLLDDDRFNSVSGREENAPERLAITADILKTRPTDVWLELFDRHDVPSAPVLRRPDLLEHAQLRANEIIVEYDHAHAGKMRQALPGAQFDRAPSQIRRGAPLIGEHSVEILTELGYSDAMIEKLIEAGDAGPV